MKFKIGIILIISLITLISCNQNSQTPEANQEGPVAKINGKAFLQPLDKNLSLALAPTTYIIIDFLDSSYCNIEYHGYRNLKASRKYTLDNGSLTIYNPVNDNVKKYLLIGENGESYLMDEQKTKLYKVLSSDTLNSYINSDNAFKKAAFLYPSLDEKEQEFGAEDRYVQGEDGRMTAVSHPLKSEVRKINIFDLF